MDDMCRPRRDAVRKILAAESPLRSCAIFERLVGARVGISDPQCDILLAEMTCDKDIVWVDEKGGGWALPRVLPQAS